MKVKAKGRVGIGVIVCLVAAGCPEPASEPSELGAEMTREMKLATPTVGGPSREIPVQGEPARTAEIATGAMKDSGVRLVPKGGTPQGQWLLGESLAGRRVLIEILPIYPNRSTVRITVEGADLLTRELLNHLYAEIADKTR